MASPLPAFDMGGEASKGRFEMADRTMVTCSLPAEDGGGQVIVSSEICSSLGVTEKGTLPEAEAMNWQATARSTLEVIIRDQPLSSQRRAVYQGVINRLR
jgi:hypothetical protein